jgi:hypothetical protein
MKNKELYQSSSAAGIKSEAWSQHNQHKNRNQHRRRLLSKNENCTRKMKIKTSTWTEVARPQRRKTGSK